MHIFCIFYGAPSAATLTRAARAARDPLLTALTLTFMDLPTRTLAHTHLLTHVPGILNSRFEFACPPGLAAARCVYVICAGNKQMEL